MNKEEESQEMKRDYIDIQDFSEFELLKLIDLITVMKKAYKERVLPDLLHKFSCSDTHSKA